MASAKLDDVDVGLVDLSHIGKTVGAKIDGDLGYNFLKHFRITLDYRKSEIRLDDPKRFESARPIDGGHRSCRCVWPVPAKPLILVDVYANGRGPFQFAIDTGTSTTAITPELAKQLGVASSPIGAATTGGAHVDVTAGVLQSFQVGGARIDDLAVIVADFFAMLSNALGREARWDRRLQFPAQLQGRVRLSERNAESLHAMIELSTVSPATGSKPPAILSLIGDTPLVEITRMDTGPCQLFVKLENQNPTGSIKDRVALAMVEAAERDGKLQPGGTIIEATAGNTGLGLALIAGAKGYRCLLVIPDKMSAGKSRACARARRGGADDAIRRHPWSSGILSGCCRPPGRGNPGRILRESIRQSGQSARA